MDNEVDEAAANADMIDLPEVPGMNNYFMDNMCYEITDEHVTPTAHEQQTESIMDANLDLEPNNPATNIDTNHPLGIHQTQ